METAASKYRRIKAEQEKNETLHDVTCSDCKMTWKARKVGIDYWVTTGVLPLGLVETMLKAVQGAKGKAEVALKSLAAKEVLQSIEFSAKVVKITAVEPRIVESIETENDITQEEVLTCCFKRLLNWQMAGGDEAEGLGNFPKE